VGFAGVGAKVSLDAKVGGLMQKSALHKNSRLHKN
jgi:hypothetical protein